MHVQLPIGMPGIPGEGAHLWRCGRPLHREHSICGRHLDSVAGDGRSAAPRLRPLQLQGVGGRGHRNIGGLRRNRRRRLCADACCAHNTAVSQKPLTTLTQFTTSRKAHYFAGQPQIHQQIAFLERPSAAVEQHTGLAVAVCCSTQPVGRARCEGTRPGSEAGDGPWALTADTRRR